MRKRMRKSSIAFMTVCALFLAVTVNAAFGMRGVGEIESVQRNLGTAENIRILGSGVNIEFIRTQQESRLEGSIDNRREFTVKEKSGFLTIEISEIGWPHNFIFFIKKKEFVKVFINDGKNIEIRSSSGDVEAGNIKFASLDIRTTSGDVYVNNSMGPMEVAAISGEINISGSAGKKNLVSKSGDITLENFEGTIEAASTSGRIKIKGITGELDLSTWSGGIYGDEVTLTADSQFRSHSSDIRLRFLNKKEDLRFDTGARSGSVNIKDPDSCGCGAILVTGRSVSGDQKYSFGHL